MKQIFLGKRIPPKKLNQNEIKDTIVKNPNTISYSSKDLKEKVLYETD